MKRISKKDMARIEGLLLQLGTHRAVLEGFIDGFQQTVDTVLQEANAVRDELRGVLEDIHGEAESHYDKRSDKWKEGDAGQAYEGWMQALDDAQVTLAQDFELDVPTDIVETIGEIEAMEIPQEPEV